MRLDRLLGGEPDRVAAQICDATAGPYEVSWDSNWPSIRVVEDAGEEVPDSWRDPPFEDVWLATYWRLERLYPGEIPLSPQA